jgi:quercetin dioxygenase-like cupin family protein
MNRLSLAVPAVAVLLTLGGIPAVAQEALSFTRTELRRADLSGAPGMEVVLSVSELEPGDEVPQHFHNGIETGYVLEGGMIQLPGQEPTALATGAPVMNLRDVPHGGYTVVGEKIIKLLTVHIVDKGEPLYDGMTP